ncbi:MAG TPA: glycosyltransferase family 39 protein [Arenimonas sp.]|nr:glycosyltransferase family 39 protein [Arenimonas sp.]
MSHQTINPSTICWFFILAFVILFAGFGLRDPWPADEPRFVLVAKQMVESGVWLFPHRGIELYPDKPPVYFWLLSICYLLTGSWRWSFLLPSLVSGMLVLYLVFDLGKRLWNPRSGLWAAIAVLATIHFAHQFKRAQIDPTLVLMTTASFYLIARHVLLGPSWGRLYLGFALAGVGVITKGVGFLPLLAVLPIVLYRKYQYMPIYQASKNDGWRWLLGLGCFLVPILLWLISIIYFGLNSGNPEHVEYMRNILFKQTAERYANPWHHKQPFWYFAQTIALLWLPFSLAWFWLFRPWRNAFVNRDLKTVFPLVWGIIVFLFFTISAGKRDMYILPALPAFAIAAAPYLQSISERLAFRRVLFAFIVILGIVFTVSGLFAWLGNTSFARKLIIDRGLGSEVIWLWWMLIGCGGITLGLSLWGGTKRVLMSVAISFTMLWLGYGFIVHPVLNASSSARAIMELARAQAGPDIEIGLVAWKEQNLLQAVGPVVEFGYLQQNDIQLQKAIAWMNAKPESRRLMINQLPEFSCIQFTAPNAIDLERANRRAWWLVNNNAVVACKSEQ